MKYKDYRGIEVVARNIGRINIQRNCE